MKTNDIQISDLMESVHTGNAQLPDFQRGWVWDDNRIIALIASITNNYPVGAAMFLDYGNENIRLKYRPIESSPARNIIPADLILDGQQRLTSIYTSMYSSDAVHTKTEKGKEIQRFYYISIEKSLDDSCDRSDAIISVPDNRIITSNFGRDTILDISNQQKEFERQLFPLNIILDAIKVQNWQNSYYAFHQYAPEIIQQFTQFYTKIVLPTLQYKMPVITLDKGTPKEAVCQVFENVNTGGVSLTVFELVTAIFAMDDFQLREDWEGNADRNITGRKEKYFSGDLTSVINATDFLTACTLLSSYKNKSHKAVSCKKKDVLNLTLQEYLQYADILCSGFQAAETLLEEDRIFSSKDLPYTTQMIPLSVICTLLQEDNRFYISSIRSKVKQWYWCGVFGELYGAANETRFANDVVGVMDWLNNQNELPKTIQEAFFNPTRLLSLQSRLSAAYKGIMALVLKNGSKDFISGRDIDFTVYQSENIDIHHIFPKAYCTGRNFSKDKWNSVVNKTPLSYQSNREIGGDAPSKYLKKIENTDGISVSELNIYIESHWIDSSCIRNDDFDGFFIRRAKMLLNAVESATGKPISGRDSEDVINTFGGPLM